MTPREQAADSKLWDALWHEGYMGHGRYRKPLNDAMPGDQEAMARIVAVLLADVEARLLSDEAIEAAARSTPLADWVPGATARMSARAALRAALATLTECAHEWADARNEVVRSGEVCVRCGAVRAGNERPA